MLRQKVLPGMSPHQKLGLILTCVTPFWTGSGVIDEDGSDGSRWSPSCGVPGSESPSFLLFLHVRVVRGTQSTHFLPDLAQAHAVQDPFRLHLQQAISDNSWIELEIGTVSRFDWDHIGFTKISCYRVAIVLSVFQFSVFHHQMFYLCRDTIIERACMVPGANFTFTKCIQS